MTEENYSTVLTLEDGMLRMPNGTLFPDSVVLTSYTAVLRKLTVGMPKMPTSSTTAGEHSQVAMVILLSVVKEEMSIFNSTTKITAVHINTGLLSTVGITLNQELLEVMDPKSASLTLLLLT